MFLSFLEQEVFCHDIYQRKIFLVPQNKKDLSCLQMTSQITTDENGFSVFFQLRGMNYIGSASYQDLQFSAMTKQTPEALQKQLHLQPAIKLLVQVPVGAVPDSLYITFDLPPVITMQVHRVKEDTVLYL
jgi:hypothetical protein